jgi:hypothetical protein
MPAAGSPGAAFPFGLGDPGAVLGSGVAYATGQHDRATSFGKLSKRLKGAVEEDASFT